MPAGSAAFGASAVAEESVTGTASVFESENLRMNWTQTPNSPSGPSSVTSASARFASPPSTWASTVDVGSAAAGAVVGVGSVAGAVSGAAGVSVFVGAGASSALLSFFSLFGVKCFLKNSLIPASWSNVSDA
jgi:hypothetical protein